MAKDIPSSGADATDVMLRIIDEKLDKRTTAIMEELERRLEALKTASSTNMDAMGKGIEADLLAIRETIKDFFDQVKEDALEADRIDKQDMLDYVNRALADIEVARELSVNVPDDDEDVEDEDVETLKLIFQKYPKSFIWMVSGLFLGIGTGWLFSFIGAWGSALAIGWLLKSIADNNEKAKKSDPWRI